MSEPQPRKERDPIRITKKGNVLCDFGKYKNLMFAITLTRKEKAPIFYIKTSELHKNGENYSRSFSPVIQWLKSSDIEKLGQALIGLSKLKEPIKTEPYQ